MPPVQVALNLTQPVFLKLAQSACCESACLRTYLNYTEATHTSTCGSSIAVLKTTQRLGSPASDWITPTGGCHLIVDAPKEVPFAVELVALVCVLRANTMLYTTCTGKRAAHCAAIGCIRMATTRAGSLPCRVSLGAASACTARGCGASHRAIPVDEVLPRLVTTELLRRAVRPQVLRVRAISIACRTSCDETTEVTGVLGV